MECPAEITKSVIDCGLRFPQAAEMLTAHDIREELIRQLEAGKFTGAKVAALLSIAPARVTEMKNRRREVQQREMVPLATFLGMVDQHEAGSPIESVYQIPNYGKVAQGVWLEESEMDPDGHSTVAYDRMRGDPPPTDLFAVTPKGTSMNLAFMPNTQLICRKIPFGSGEYRPGDYVIAQRKAHDLVEMTVKRLEVNDDGTHWLHSESTDEKYREPWPIGAPDENHHDDREIRILAKVIRAVQDFERPQ